MKEYLNDIPNIKLHSSSKASSNNLEPDSVKIGKSRPVCLDRKRLMMQIILNIIEIS